MLPSGCNLKAVKGAVLVGDNADDVSEEWWRWLAALVVNVLCVHICVVRHVASELWLCQLIICLSVLQLSVHHWISLLNRSLIVI